MQYNYVSKKLSPFSTDPKHVMIHIIPFHSDILYRPECILYAIQPKCLCLSHTFMASLRGLWASILDFQEFNYSEAI